MRNLWITFLDVGGDMYYNDSNDMEKVIISRIIKTGNSLCVVIPKNILRALNWERGDQIVFGIFHDEALMISKISPVELLKLKIPN